MKWKEVIYLLGIKPKPKVYGFDVVSFQLPGDGEIQYARWRHPREATRKISQGSIDGIRKFLKPGDVAIDIGAHTGDSTIPIALAVGKDGCVLALEPNRYVFPVLEKNSTLNSSMTNIVPLMFAATPSDGEISFEYSDPGFSNGGRHIGVSKWLHTHAFKLNVTGRNLDNYLRTEQSELLPRIKYIKIDAEGFDFEIVKSISGFIKEFKPYLKVEVFSWVTEPVRKEMIGFIKDLGYDIFHVTADDNYFGEQAHVDNVMAWRCYDIFCVPE